MLPLLAAALLVMGGLAQPTQQTPPSKPAAARLSARLSPNVCIITLDGEIDALTSVSVRRRIAEAERSGADAIVVQIDSPGGELGAVMEITSALKKSSIARTVAWVNPTAYSGGAIVALACSEIVISSGGNFGDAAPIYIKSGPLGNRTLVPLPQTERAKILSPLLAEIVGSARRNGYDEKLAQGMAAVGVELWLVENTETGERLCIDRREYGVLFADDAPTANPRLVGPPDARPSRELRQRPRRDLDPTDTSGPPGAAPVAPADRTEFLPASPAITKQTARETSLALSVPSTRPVLTQADRGKWRLIEYVADGSSLFTFNDGDLLDLRIASARVDKPDELARYLGATNTITLTPAWYEAVARVLQSPLIRGVLIIVVILGLFIEFIHPGLILPASAAGLAILGLLLPEILMGLAGWWEVVMIVGGVVLICVELFIMPGMAIPGAVGLLSLLAGLVLAFAPASSPTFPGMERSSAPVLWGVGFVLIGLTTAAAVGYYMSKNMRTLPLLGRLILSDRPRDEDLEGEPTIDAPAPTLPVVKGQEGIALTTLRPSGKADFDGRVIDVVSDGPMIPAGARIRVAAADQFRISVEPV